MDKNILVIKAFHITDVTIGEKITLKNRELKIKKIDEYEKLLKESKKLSSYIKKIKINIIPPENKNLYVNSIMDFIPISTKVLGNIGYGITHTLTGVVAMLTGCDEKGNQICEFGKSDGILEKVVKFDMAGTPKKNDFIINVDVEVFEKTHANRECIDVCHEFCDLVLSDIREILKKKDGLEADERHDFIENTQSLGKKVVILKQVAGQGAMYDTRVFPEEPSGFLGSYSIIDLMNTPIFVTKNEYRDGAVRAMH